MVQYFRSCKHVTPGYGGAGFVTGVLVVLCLLLPLYDYTGVEFSKDYTKISIKLTLGMQTPKNQNLLQSHVKGNYHHMQSAYKWFHVEI